MKPLICILTLCTALAGLSPALAEEPDYKQFTDIIYEWSPGGNAIQVGDFTISKIKSVWLDKGQRDARGLPILSRTGKGSIKVGNLATPLMLEKDREGRWIAEKLIVYSGNGVKEALKLVPATVKKAYLSDHN